MEGQTLEKTFVQQVEKFCTGGRSQVETDAGKQQLRKAAANKRLKLGDVSYFNRMGEETGGLKLSISPTCEKLMVDRCTRLGWPPTTSVV